MSDPFVFGDDQCQVESMERNSTPTDELNQPILPTVVQYDSDIVQSLPPSDQAENVQQISSESLDITSGNMSIEKELKVLQEIVPSIETSVLKQILIGNKHNLEKSIDAALALNSYLSSEKGMVKIESGKSADKFPKTYSNFSVDNNQSRTNSLSRSSSIKLSNSPTNKRNSSKSVEAQSKGKSYRGLPLILSLSFLSCPRYHRIIDRNDEYFTAYTIHFARQTELLGITIRENDGEIVIHHLHAMNHRPCLAMEAGVKIGDVLTGINGDYFSPGVEVQDVIDMLELAGRFVTLHFLRNHRPSQTPTYHRCVQMFIEQGVIKVDKAQYLTKVLNRLKDRVIQWDNGWIAQRIESWKLYKGLGLNVPTSSSSDFSNANALGSSLTSTLGSSFFGSILSSSTSNAPVLGSDLPSENKNKRSSGQWDPNTISSTKSYTSNLHDDNDGREKNVHMNLSSGSGRGKAANDIVIGTKNLRPALSIRLLRAEENGDHFVYVIWVMDIKSGVEWIVKRRFREFFEFRDLLISIRPSISQLDFPPKRISVGEPSAVINERLQLKQKFLRRLLSLVTLNSLHPSTARVQLALQHFLEVSIHWNEIAIAEKNPSTILKHTVQVYVHSVMQVTVMDKVLNLFLDNFSEDSLEEERRVASGGGDAEYGVQLIHSLRDYIDNLQNVLYDGIYEDCMDIMKHYCKNSSVSIPGLKLKQESVALDSNDLSAANQEDARVGEGIARDDGDGVSKDEMEINTIFDRLTEDELRMYTRSAIRRQVEIELYVPCAAKIGAMMDSNLTGKESLLKAKMFSLRQQEQTFFGIPSNHTSPSQWSAIVSKLKKLRMKSLPHDRLEALVDAAKEIPARFRMEHSSNQKPLGADEFLPIFIFILIQAQIPNVLTLNEEIQTFCDPDKRMSETGYYMATLEASLQHIMEYDDSKIVDNFFSSSSFKNSAYPFSDLDDNAHLNRLDHMHTPLTPRNETSLPNILSPRLQAVSEELQDVVSKLFNFDFFTRESEENKAKDSIENSERETST